MHRLPFKRSENNVIAFLKFLFKIPDTQWQRTRTRITVMLNIHQNFLHRNFHAMSYRFDDAHIGLMGNNPVNVIFCQPVLFCYSCTDIRHIRDSVLEHSSTFLMNIMHFIVNREIRRRTNRTTRFHVEERQSLTIGTNNDYFFISSRTNKIGSCFHQIQESATSSL